MTLSLEALEISADPGLVMVAYAAEPGSASATALARLRERRAPVGGDPAAP
jgi:hypothetical protein